MKKQDSGKKNPMGKVTLVLKDLYPKLQEEAQREQRNAKAQAEFIIRQHLEQKTGQGS